MPKESEKGIESGRSLVPVRRLFMVALVFVSALFVGSYFYYSISNQREDEQFTQFGTYDACLASPQSLSVDSCIQVEIVNNQRELIRGLSGREKLEGGTGMLFDFGSPGRRCMWMNEMKFGLDMVWLDNQKRITAVEESVLPESFPELFCGGDKDRYVLEINEGEVAKQGLSVGQYVDW